MLQRGPGVSPGTVSRYLNGHRLREQNRLRVEQAIEELDFKENIIAKGLKGNRSMTIAVMIPHLILRLPFLRLIIMQRLAQ